MRQALVKKSNPRNLIAVVIILFGMMLTPWASAQCGSLYGPKAVSSGFQAGAWLAPGKPTSGSLLLVSDDRFEEAGIVGLWKVLFVAEGNSGGPPDGTTIDFGFAQWHSDGTEILNSGMRAPATGNFCLGVWKKVGRFTYRLNHFALSYDSNGSFVGPANIREEVVLDRDGDRYSGTFAIDQFDQQQNLIAHVAGRATGTRVTVNTKP